MSPTPEILYTDRSPLGPPPLRRPDSLAPRPQPPGEGEGLALFWDLVRTFQGRVNRMDFRHALLALIKAGRLADAWLLAVQFDREEEIAEQPPAPGGGPRVCIEPNLPIRGWHEARRQRGERPAPDEIDHNPPPTAAPDWRQSDG